MPHCYPAGPAETGIVQYKTRSAKLRRSYAQPRYFARFLYFHQSLSVTVECGVLSRNGPPKHMPR